MAWNKVFSDDRLEYMAFVCLALYTGFAEISGQDPVYKYPLADYTGTAEVVYGGRSGYDGLGFVSSYTPHPSLSYNSLYFHGTSLSFAELHLGTEEPISTDWSFTMFVYFSTPHRGTIFDFVYDMSAGGQQGQLWSNKIKLELNETHIIFTILGPAGQDFGSDVIGTIFAEESWIPLSVIHDESSGDVTIQTLDTEIFTNKGFYKNQNKVQLAQPAKIKIGGSYDSESYPFEGSIVCFVIHNVKVSLTSFPDALNQCQPIKWRNSPLPIDISNITTQAPPTKSTDPSFSGTTTSTAEAQSTTSTTTSEAGTTTSTSETETTTSTTTSEAGTTTSTSETETTTSTTTSEAGTTTSTSETETTPSTTTSEAGTTTSTSETETTPSTTTSEAGTTTSTSETETTTSTTTSEAGTTTSTSETETTPSTTTSEAGTTTSTSETQTTPSTTTSEAGTTTSTSETETTTSTTTSEAGTTTPTSETETTPSTTTSEAGTTTSTSETETTPSTTTSEAGTTTSTSETETTTSTTTSEAGTTTSTSETETTPSTTTSEAGTTTSTSETETTPSTTTSEAGTTTSTSETETTPSTTTSEAGTKTSTSVTETTTSTTLSESGTTTSTTTSTTIAGTSSTTVLPATTGHQVIYHPEYYGYFEAVATDTRPSAQAMFSASHIRSNRKCGRLCLVIPECLCFSYSSSTNLCSLYDKIHDSEVDYGTIYYMRRDISLI